MKKTFLASLGIVFLLLNTGCNDLLEEEPVASFTPEFLQTSQGIEAGLTGVYSGNRTFYGNEEGMNMTVTGTDEFMMGGTVTSLNQYNATLNSTTGAVQNRWALFYTYINAANGVIKYAPTVSSLSPARVQQIVAEAKLLRANYYFLLVQFWGDVPLSLEFTEAPNKNTSRTPMATVYEAIIQDLTDALAGLPTKLAPDGRVTKPAALHLLAKVYLTRASSTARQSGDYANAARHAKTLLDNQATYGVGLLPDVKQVFAEGNENSTEVLFNVQYNNNTLFNSQQNSANFYFRMEYDREPNMARDIVNGRPWFRYRPTSFLLDNVYQDRVNDTRYNKWFTTVWYVNSPGANGATGTRRLTTGDTAVWMPGRMLPASVVASKRYKVILPSQYNYHEFPTLNKYDDTKRVAVNDASVRPFIVYRLAETYLIAAEALLMDGKATEAVPYINAVRRRAAATGRQAAMEVTASQLTLDFILNERARELSGEQMRWLDLVRTNKLVERVRLQLQNPFGAEMTLEARMAGTSVQPFHQLRPIPQTEIDRSTGNMPQNQGY